MGVANTDLSYNNDALGCWGHERPCIWGEGKLWWERRGYRVNYRQVLEEGGYGRRRGRGSTGHGFGRQIWRYIVGQGLLLTLYLQINNKTGR